LVAGITDRSRFTEPLILPSWRSRSYCFRDQETCFSVPLTRGIQGVFVFVPLMREKEGVLILVSLTSKIRDKEGRAKDFPLPWWSRKPVRRLFSEFPEASFRTPRDLNLSRFWECITLVMRFQPCRQTCTSFLPSPLGQSKTRQEGERFFLSPWRERTKERGQGDQ
jgi:hypothetical protein